ncbi:hypothetical protein C2845_PM04G28800 [Panicum miliaceum]|uniref:Uncharacterized protein n=1 Tax=Panicum miliaceum TaxID=4540 RepID=A0A3L6QL79_PANMI|nr:hypothetical protein C2845_PM04G28800 [Panicum miliaceum]
MRCSQRYHGRSPPSVAVRRPRVPRLTIRRRFGGSPPRPHPATALAALPAIPWPRPGGLRPVTRPAVGPCRQPAWLAAAAGLPSAIAAASTGAAGRRRAQSAWRGLGGAPTSSWRVRWLPRCGPPPLTVLGETDPVRHGGG